MKKQIKKQIEEYILKNNLHLVDIIITSEGDLMIYYREKGSTPTDVKTKVFYK